MEGIVLADELKRKQLYFNFEIDGYYAQQNIYIFQVGIYGFKLKPKAEERKFVKIGPRRPEQCCVHIQRQILPNGHEQHIIKIESSAGVHNATDQTLTLAAVNQGQPTTTVDNDTILVIPSKATELIPLQWFIERKQVQLIFNPPEDHSLREDW